jgi:23S rRNA (adenine2503-C2)-methyltransferase
MTETKSIDAAAPTAATGVPNKSKPHALNLSLKDWTHWTDTWNLASSSTPDSTPDSTPTSTQDRIEPGNTTPDRGAPRAVAPAYLGKQIRRWLFQRGTESPEQMSDLGAAIRKTLASEFDWSLDSLLTVNQYISSADGSEKILFRTMDGRFAECVLMPSPDRVTVCISSQVGCRMACTFCQTGKIGFSRNLSSGEILGQILLCQKRLAERGAPRTRITNVVFMGMGEPLDNIDAVIEACQTMVDPNGFGMSKHRVTVSTCGLVPEIERLGQSVAVSLAISLHAANDRLRSSMMPINKRYDLETLKQALLTYPVQTRHGITFEYVLINGVNDSLTDAKQLVRFVHGLKAKVNLIPMNPHPGSPMTQSHESQIRAFQSYLSARSIPAPVRYSRGQDVSGACGQLAAKKKEELDIAPRQVALARRREQIQERAQGSAT